MNRQCQFCGAHPRFSPVDEEDARFLPDVSRSTSGLSETGYSRCSWRGIPRDLSLTFVAEDGATSRFHSWTGSCSAFGASRTCTIRASAALDVTARFSPWRLWLPVFGPGEIRAEPMPGTPLGWSCGFACVDYLNGSVLRLRAADT
jgi:hypothetical protein